MDFSLIIGIVIGLGAILLGYTIEEGKLAALLLLSPFLIVIGGTIGATIASFSLKDILNALKAVKFSFSKKSKGNPNLIIEKISELSELTRREGLLKIEEKLNDPELASDD